MLLAALLYRATPQDFIAMLRPNAAEMTPNGAVVFGLVIIAGSLVARDLPGLAIVLAVALISG